MVLMLKVFAVIELVLVIVHFGVHVLNRDEFPSGFVFGASTSAYQYSTVLLCCLACLGALFFVTVEEFAMIWLSLVEKYVFLIVNLEFVLIVICQVYFVSGPIALRALRVVEAWQLIVVVAWEKLGKQAITVIHNGFDLICLILFSVIGIFYSVLVATMVGQRIWQRHYHILVKRMLTKVYLPRFSVFCALYISVNFLSIIDSL